MEYQMYKQKCYCQRKCVTHCVTEVLLSGEEGESHILCKKSESAVSVLRSDTRAFSKVT